MRHLLTFSFSIISLFLCHYSNAQDIKTKSKSGKTKVKEEAGKTTTNISGIANNMNTPTNTSSLTNTSWKNNGGPPLNDTAIWRLTTDTSFFQSQSGEIFATSIYTVAHDTLSLYDIGGKYACPSDRIGKYRFIISNDIITLDLVEDDCVGRAILINAAKLQKVK